MKHRHDMTGTGKFMKLWGYRSSHKCPRCGHHCETAAHVTMCTVPSAIEQWKISLETDAIHDDKSNGMENKDN
jgi:hypothetical protein